jgi:formate-dependent phosphoribosylglycinamide formyltransferase (GAR transformylase)
MNVIFLSPGYPSEMPSFVRALAQVGAQVLGVGDQPPGALPETTRRALADYLRVPSLWDEEAVIAAIRRWVGHREIARVECLWEPGVVLAGAIRDALGVPGLSAEQSLPFRNKELMKQVLDRAGIRTPRHVAARTVSACWEAAHAIGFPVILKPIAGAGSADTYRCDDEDALRAALAKLRHVPEVSVEEFVDGEEYTFDTVSIQGHIAFWNVAWYRPRPLIARSNEWISPQVVALREVDRPELADGVAMGRAVLAALGFESGFTHMEWYRKADGEVVFGEIGGRPPGAHHVDQMNWANDIDIFVGWAEAVCHARFSQAVERKYNVATIYKRAQGIGRIREIENYDALRAKLGPWLVWDNLLPVGSPRRDWRQTLVSDGFWMLRHPELATCLAMADEVGTKLRLYAG